MANYRPMRLHKQQISQEEALSVLRKASYGVLATVNENSEPRTVAVNYILLDEHTLLFHGSNAGEKIDNIRKNPAVSFFVVDQARILADKFDTAYLSVSVQGRAEILEDRDEIYAHLVKLTQHLAPESTEEQIRAYTYPSRIGKVAVILVHIEDIKGKRSP